MKIALVGSAPSSTQLAPYRDASYQRFIQGKTPAYPPAEHVNDEWEIWACSPGVYGVAVRITRFFEVHRWEPGQTWFSPEYCQFLRDFRGPVYVGGPIPEIKNAVLYPTEAVEEAFSPYFLTSSLSLMFALAIFEIEGRRARRAAARRGRDRTVIWERSGPHDGPLVLPLDEQMPVEMADELITENDSEDTIGMWGVDMSAGEEWEHQRPGCHFFILEALRRGIRVFMPPESDVLNPMPIYGLSEWDPKYIKATARARELSGRITAHQAQVAENARLETYLKGAVDNMNYFIKTHLSDHGLPSGIYLRHQPGTGLGAGVRPFGTLLQVGPKPAPIGGDHGRSPVPVAQEGLADLSLSSTGLGLVSERVREKPTIAKNVRVRFGEQVPKIEAKRKR